MPSENSDHSVVLKSSADAPVVLLAVQAVLEDVAGGAVQGGLNRPRLKKPYRLFNGLLCGYLTIPRISSTVIVP
jgi:hypothetical protein